MFRVISEYDAVTWYESKNYEDCEEYLNNCSDVAVENGLFIEDF